MTQNGFYTGNFTSHTPDGSSGYWNVEVQLLDNNPSYVVQRACKTNSAKYFIRSLNGGKETDWSEWEEFATKDDLSNKLDFLNLDTLGNSFITGADETGAYIKYFFQNGKQVVIKFKTDGGITIDKYDGQQWRTTETLSQAGWGIV